MSSVAPLLFLALVSAATYFVWDRIRIQRLSRERLTQPQQPDAAERLELAPGEPFVQKHLVLPWVFAAALGLCLRFLIHLPPIFAVTFALIAGLLGAQLEQLRVSWLTFKIEQQLADALDMMVAGLQAGVGVTTALEHAALETRKPLQPQLTEVLGRIRYGDDPQTVLRALEQRVPLEVFRLFVSALSVHWETGGSLAPTLATVGRVVRDRIEVSRRIRSLTAQSRVSVVAVIGLTYFLGVAMWRNDPDRMEAFLATSTGQYAIAGALLLQAVGIVWSSALSRLKY